MPLCAVIGDGPVGRYVAGRLHQVVPDAAVVGLRKARPWLRPLFPDAKYLASLQFGSCRDALQDVGANEVVFAVEAYGSFFPMTLDTLAISYQYRQSNYWLPFSFLTAFQKFLSDNNIALKSVLDYFPEMSAEVGFEVGRFNGYRGDADLSAAKRHAEQLPRRQYSRSWIVSDGKVLKGLAGIARTNDLIRAFGKTAASKHEAFPVLCKISLTAADRIDVPTIGEDTVKLCLDNGIRGIVLEAGSNILLQRDQVIRLASEKLFYVGAR